MFTEKLGFSFPVQNALSTVWCWVCLLPSRCSVARLSRREPEGWRGLCSLFTKLRQAFSKPCGTLQPHPFQLSASGVASSACPGPAASPDAGVTSVAGAACSANPQCLGALLLPLERVVSDQRTGVPFGLTALCKPCGAEAAWRHSLLFP